MLNGVIQVPPVPGVKSMSSAGTPMDRQRAAPGQRHRESWEVGWGAAEGER